MQFSEKIRNARAKQGDKEGIPAIPAIDIDCFPFRLPVSWQQVMRRKPAHKRHRGSNQLQSNQLPVTWQDILIPHIVHHIDTNVQVICEKSGFPPVFTYVRLNEIPEC